MWVWNIRGFRNLARVNASLLGLCLVLMCGNARALTSMEFSFDQMVAQSDLILVGTVESLDSFWGEGQSSGTIFSYIYLNDLQAIKGNLPAAEYRLRVIGGAVGDQAQFYPGLPEFKPGKRYLLFIQGNDHAMFPIVGAAQGFYRVQWDADHQQQIAIPTVHNQNHNLSRGVSLPGGQTQTLESLIGQIRNSLQEQ
jgi:hypothetical protein